MSETEDRLAKLELNSQIALLRMGSLMEYCLCDWADCDVEDRSESVGSHFLKDLQDDGTLGDESSNGLTLNRTFSLGEFSRTELSAITEEGLISFSTVDTMGSMGDATASRYAFLRQQLSRTVESVEEDIMDRYAPAKTRGEDKYEVQKQPSVRSSVAAEQIYIMPSSENESDGPKKITKDDDESVEKAKPVFNDLKEDIQNELEQKNFEIENKENTDPEKLERVPICQGVEGGDEDIVSPLLTHTARSVPYFIYSKLSVLSEITEVPEIQRSSTSCTAGGSPLVDASGAPIFMYDATDLCDKSAEVKEHSITSSLPPVQEGELFQDLSLRYIKASEARRRADSVDNISSPQTCDVSVLSSVGESISAVTVFHDAVSFLTYADDIVTSIPAENTEEDCSVLDLQSALADIDECISHAGTFMSATASAIVAPSVISVVEGNSKIKSSEATPPSSKKKWRKSNEGLDNGKQSCSETVSTGMDTAWSVDNDNDVSLKYVRITPGRLNSVLLRYKNLAASPPNSHPLGQQRVRRNSRTPLYNRKSPRLFGSRINSLHGNECIESPVAIERKKNLLLGKDIQCRISEGDLISNLSSPNVTVTPSKFDTPCKENSNLSWSVTTSSLLGAAITTDPSREINSPLTTCSSISKTSSLHSMDTLDFSSTSIMSPASIVRTRRRGLPPIGRKCEIDESCHFNPQDLDMELETTDENEISESHKQDQLKWLYQVIEIFMLFIVTVWIIMMIPFGTISSRKQEGSLADMNDDAESVFTNMFVQSVKLYRDLRTKALNYVPA